MTRRTFDFTQSRLMWIVCILLVIAVILWVIITLIMFGVIR